MCFVVSLLMPSDHVHHEQPCTSLSAPHLPVLRDGSSEHRCL
ncbi:hypothetical protein HSB1_30840 [Halogranum salarium B-1]|uniref:Uncharacterized protein n=1 Tax=Halogranum salarium B-1 TaxID=1210908 RepID=J3JER9_9EURY|nr:hypothetical protein HSB1_30840 [Halogranum salarium B-1]